jgi:hypothetical protein
MATNSDPTARCLTANPPTGTQVWLYELKPNQEPKAFQISGGAPPTATPKYIVAYAEQHEQRTVRLYIPTALIRVTLKILKSLPHYSHISKEDIDNAPKVSLVAAPGDFPSLNIIKIRGLLIPATLEVANTYTPILRPSGISAPGQSGVSLCISYWLNVICSAGTEFHQAVLDWARKQQHLVSSAEGFAHTLHRDSPLPQSQPMTDRDRLCDTYIALSLGFKRVNETYISEWATRRINAILATLGEPKIVNVGALPYATTLSSFLRSQPSLLSRLVDVILANRNNPSNTMLSSVCNGVIMIAEYSGMTTAQSARAFFNTCESGALSIGDIFEEGQRLIRVWDALQRRHGDRFPYARALNLPGVEGLDVRNFPNLAYCAWFSKSSDPKYKNLVAPKPTLDVKMLQVYTLTPIRATIGANLTQEKAKYPVTRK